MQEDSKIYRNARFLAKFFEEQLIKLLPDYVSKRLSGEKKSCEATPSKRLRLDNRATTEIIDDGDDDVILA